MTVAEKSERTSRSNLHRDMQLSCQKSADAIVPKKNREGQNVNSFKFKERLLVMHRTQPYLEQELFPIAMLETSKSAEKGVELPIYPADEKRRLERN